MQSPLHLAIIPDGNRRWAKKQMLKPWKGHERAIENFKDITDFCRKSPRIGILTVWCFSTENWKRDPEEVERLMKLYEEYIQNERKTLIEKKTRFVHSGRIDRIPSSLAKLIHEVAEETKDQSEFMLHLALDYGGKDEIVRAVNRLEETKKRRNEETKLEDIDEESFRKFLDHPELTDIDIVLRTSGEQRTSNFFLWQTAYSEWIFTEKLFPELTTEDIEEALEEFDRRKRRFGS